MTDSSLQRPTLLLIDANSIIHRCFHALPPLTARDGAPAQALYGVANILLRIVTLEAPRYAAACFDRPEPTFRKQRFAEYKAQRPPAPDELISQIIEAHHTFAAFGVRAVEAPGYEADDLIATFARRFGGHDGLRAEILTGDLDTLQLVRDGAIVVRAFRQGVTDTIRYDEAAIRERFGGLEPAQLADYKALVGDASDNIKGVPGIGPKTAIDILRRYGSLEAALAHAGDDPVLVKRLQPHAAQARFSKELVVLAGETPVALELPDLMFRFDADAAAAYIERLGFASILRRLRGEGPKTARTTARHGRAPRRAPPESQGAMF
jgi:DNA polymerase-1